MSHIPSAAMPHAGPVHDDEPSAKGRKAKPGKPGKGKKEKEKAEAGAGWPVAAVALGGALVLGAIAVAVPLVRGSADDKASPPKKKAGGRRKKG